WDSFLSGTQIYLSVAKLCIGDQGNSVKIAVAHDDQRSRTPAGRALERAGYGTHGTTRPIVWEFSGCAMKPLNAKELFGCDALVLESEAGRQQRAVERNPLGVSFLSQRSNFNNGVGLLAHHANKDFHDAGVELCVGAALQFGQGVGRAAA